MWQFIFKDRSTSKTFLGTWGQHVGACRNIFRGRRGSNHTDRQNGVFLTHQKPERNFPHFLTIVYCVFRIFSDIGGLLQPPPHPPRMPMCYTERRGLLFYLFLILLLLRQSVNDITLWVTYIQLYASIKAALLNVMLSFYSSWIYLCHISRTTSIQLQRHSTNQYWWVYLGPLGCVLTPTQPQRTLGTSWVPVSDKCRNVQALFTRAVQ